MNQRDQSAPEVKKKIALDQNPSPDQEGGFFSNTDEIKQAMKNQHELDIHDRNLGVIGKITGSTNASLNIAASLLLLLTLTLLVSICLSTAYPNFMQIVEKIIAAVLTVAGFIFGVQQRRD